MAKKKKLPKRKPKKLNRRQLLEVIIDATDRGGAIYDFFPGSKRLDFLNMYCDGLIKPGGTKKQGWVTTTAGREQLGYD